MASFPGQSPEPFHRTRSPRLETAERGIATRTRGRSGPIPLSLAEADHPLGHPLQCVQIARTRVDRPPAGAGEDAGSAVSVHRELPGELLRLRVPDGGSLIR